MDRRILPNGVLPRTFVIPHLLSGMLARLCSVHVYLVGLHQLHAADLGLPIVFNDTVLAVALTRRSPRRKLS